MTPSQAVLHSLSDRFAAVESRRARVTEIIVNLKDFKILEESEYFDSGYLWGAKVIPSALIPPNQCTLGFEFLLPEDPDRMIECVKVASGPLEY